ncbi:MAG: cupin [Chloroflexota bacterium]|nr:cupin [Chloroflexota bacterium]
MSAEQLAARLRAEGLTPSSWGNSPGDRYGEHAHAYDKVLVATAGSIVFHLPELGVEVELRAGERLELPAETRHGATVGEHGVNCLEAHLPAGSLGRRPHHRRQW